MLFRSAKSCARCAAGDGAQERPKVEVLEGAVGIAGIDRLDGALGEHVGHSTDEAAEEEHAANFRWVNGTDEPARQAAGGRPRRAPA